VGNGALVAARSSPVVCSKATNSCSPVSATMNSDITIEGDRFMTDVAPSTRGRMDSPVDPKY
jgi:hypothetical protein